MTCLVCCVTYIQSVSDLLNQSQCLLHLFLDFEMVKSNIFWLIPLANSVLKIIVIIIIFNILSNLCLD